MILLVELEIKLHIENDYEGTVNVEFEEIENIDIQGIFKIVDNESYDLDFGLDNLYWSNQLIDYLKEYEYDVDYSDENPDYYYIKLLVVEGSSDKDLIVIAEYEGKEYD